MYIYIYIIWRRRTSWRVELEVKLGDFQFSVRFEYFAPKDVSCSVILMGKDKEERCRGRQRGREKGSVSQLS